MNAEKLLIFLFIPVFLRVDCEIFSAIEELEKLATDEGLIIKELEKFSVSVNDDYVSRKLKAWQNEHSIVEQDVTQYITNPLNAFLLIKRATSDVKLIEEKFPEKSKEFLEFIKKFQPEDADLSGAVDGLLRLQTVYKLKTEDFANGIIDGEKTRSELTPHDLFIIGEEAFKLDNHDFFVKDYFNLALKLVNDGKDVENEVVESEALFYLAMTYNKTGDYENALQTINDLIIKSPDRIDFKNLSQMFSENFKKFKNSNFFQFDPLYDTFVKNNQYTKDKEMLLFSQVCRGIATKTLEEQSKLHCRYSSTNSYTKLARFKIEEANLDPYLIVFIDVLSDDEVDILKRVAKSKIKRAQTWTATLETKKANNRVAQTAAHLEKDHEIFKKLTQRVEDMSGLSQKTAETFQIQNYGIGGHYEPHWDCLMKWDKPFEYDGNRIATTLFYLSDVEKGGATVFPYVKARIPARKGTAAFWHNLKVSGQGDMYTRHAACPVLLGSKWVSNKWIREHGNEFRRPCVPEQFIESDWAPVAHDVF